MQRDTSPMDHLLAFTIVFVTGILTAVSFSAYVERVRRKAVQDHCERNGSEPILPTQVDANRSMD